jgi:hypothetical protein
MGGNPQASQGSLLACPTRSARSDGIRAAAARRSSIDPRRTGTADEADEWIPIWPGTDAAFLLALQRPLRRRLVRLGALAGRVNGVERCGPLARTSARARRGDVPRAGRDDPASRARDRRRAVGGGVRPHRPLQSGVRHARSWLIDVVNVLTGNFDRPGGSCSVTRSRGA